MTVMRSGDTPLVFDRIAANKRETVLLLAAFVTIIGGLVAAFLFAWGVPSDQMPGVLGFVGIGLILYAVFAYFGSTSVVLSIAGAHEVTKDEEWEFVRRSRTSASAPDYPCPAPGSWKTPPQTPSPRA